MYFYSRVKYSIIFFFLFDDAYRGIVWITCSGVSGFPVGTM